MKKKKHDSFKLDVKCSITPPDWGCMRDFSVYMSIKDRLRLIFRLLTQKDLWFKINRDML